MSKGYLQGTCRIGQGAKCCRYITMGALGWKCGKTDSVLKTSIDAVVWTMRAKGDNCAGVLNLHEIAEKGTCDMKGIAFIVTPSETRQ